MTANNKPRIGITLGDLNGIGPEVVLKALSDNRFTISLLQLFMAQHKVISFYKKQLNIEELNYTQVRNKGQFAMKSINVINCWEESLEIITGESIQPTQAKQH